MNILLLVSVLALAACDPAGSVDVDNRSAINVLLRYHEGAYQSVVESQAGTAEGAFVKIGGLSGAVDILALDCTVLQRNLVVKAIGSSVIVIDANGTATVSLDDGDRVGNARHAKVLANDRC
jgi:hypothetical protein